MGFMKKPVYSFILPILDGATIVGSLILAIILRGRSFSGDFTLIGAPFYGEVIFLILYGAATTLIFQYLSLYKINVFVTVADQIVRIVKALALSILGIAILSFFTKASFIVDSRLAIIYFAALAFTLMLGGRVVIFRNLFLYLSRHKVIHRNILVIGAGQSGKNLAVNIFLNEHLGLNVVGFLDDELPLGKVIFNRTQVLGRVHEVEEIVKVFEIDEVVVCLEGVGYTHLIEVLERCIATKAAVKISSPLYDVVPARLFLEKYGDVPVVGVSQFTPSPFLEHYKRVFDSAVVAVALVFLLPVFLLISVLVKLDSPGPIFFSQVRIGKNGKPFRFYKFRSMLVGSDNDDSRKKTAVEFIKKREKVLAENGGTATKIVNESRVTRVGQWLRKLSLDELPQLFNVLKGDMSLVGPRPCLPYEWENYEEWHKRRLSVIPGCTGMWQVVGRSTVGFEDMVVLDLYYIQNASALLDFSLILKTVPVMLLGSGAK